MKNKTKTPHTSCPRGKRVRVVLKDGEEFVDKFQERIGNRVIFFEKGSVRAGNIKSFSIYREIKRGVENELK